MRISKLIETITSSDLSLEQYPLHVQSDLLSTQ